MPQTQCNCASAAAIDRPRCRRCDLEMWLSRISPSRHSREWHTFECPACEISQRYLATMKLVAAARPL